VPHRLALAFVLVIAACSRAPVASCDDDLGGTWRAPDGMRWALLDHDPGHGAIEGYPMAPDAPNADNGAAPRALDLTHAARGLTGTITRRFTRGPDTCEARVAVHVSACGAELELVTSDVPRPLGFAPCRWPPAAPSHGERWHRE
jgi:hypothetical protein